MKILNSITQKKYETNKYNAIGNNVYQNINENKYCITLYCILKDDEDTQYPLEDMLDKYCLNCTDYFETCIINEKNVFIFELEGEKENVLKIVSIIGKEIF